MATKTGGKVALRSDTKPEEGRREYGDVTFADPTNKKISDRYSGTYSGGVELYKPQGQCCQI